MRTRIKICGVRDVETAMAAAQAGTDAVGLVFAAGSPRRVSLDEAARIVRALPAFVEPVGLFVDEPAEAVLETARSLGLRTVQLHGSEAPAVVEQLRPLRVIKALAFEDTRLRDTLGPWRSAGDNLAALLWDAPPPADGALTGGHGRRFDWTALGALQQDGGLVGLPPAVLAGGLTPDNVGEAVRTLRPFGVDVSSGVESSRGLKDPARIAAFCEAVREADRGREETPR